MTHITLLEHQYIGWELVEGTDRRTLLQILPFSEMWRHLFGRQLPTLCRTLPACTATVKLFCSENRGERFLRNYDNCTASYPGIQHSELPPTHKILFNITASMPWTVRGSNPGGGEIFRTRPDRPWGPPSLYNCYRVFPGEKGPGRDVHHPSRLAPKLKKE